MDAETRVRLFVWYISIMPVLLSVCMLWLSWRVLRLESGLAKERTDRKASDSQQVDVAAKHTKELDELVYWDEQHDTDRVPKTVVTPLNMRDPLAVPPGED